MAEEQSKELETNASLLEDASTLLMFHSAAVTNYTPPHDEPSQPVVTKPERETAPPMPEVTAPKPLKRLLPNNVQIKKSPSPTVKPLISGQAGISNLTSPGPAIAALSESDFEHNKSQKAIVAAAALAAAAGIPMLLSRRDDISVDESLRATIKAKSRTEWNAIANTIKHEVSQEHVEALQEKAADIRREISEQEDQETDVEETPQGEPRLDAMDVDENATTADEKEFNETEVEREEEPAPKSKRQKKASTSSIPNDWIVDPDAGIISCVCGYEDDDGFTIQCDHCNRWQHAVCMGIDDIDDAPEQFRCNVCQPRRIDAKRARAVQGKRLAELRGKRGKPSSDEESVDEKPTVEEQKEDKTTKPKPKPVSAYNRNLEESDIPVPDPKNVWRAVYYELKNYDYQDQQVYNYVQGMSKDDSLRLLSANEFDDYDFPKTKVKSYSDVNSKKFNGIMRLGLFTESKMEAYHIVEEYLGEVGFRDKYISDPRNQYRIWGVEKGYVSFIPNTPLVIDARTSGNKARYIRRSCHPNCELRPLKTDDEIKFVIVTIKGVKAGTELTLPWNWYHLHPILNIQRGQTFDSTVDADKPSLVLSVESILTFVDCGCPATGSDCALSKVKKASAHIYRSTRKGNSTSGMKLLQREAQYVSIQDRLNARDQSNINDSQEQANMIPFIGNSSTLLAEAQVTVKPFIYSYFKKKSRDTMNAEVEKLEYLPVPIPLIPDQLKSEERVMPAKPVKKLSFADYKKKLKPSS